LKENTIMKKLQRFTYLFGLLALILAACTPGRVPPSPGQATQSGDLPSPVELTPIQTPAPDANTRTFSSDIYHYKVSYPTGWTIQVNTSVASGAGSNPEFVTLTTADPSGLPRIDIEVLTDAPPMPSFNGCEQNSVFRNLPACHISLPGGQFPGSDLWIFQNGSAYFFIGMQYAGTEPIQVFSDFLSSFEFTQSQSSADPLRLQLAKERQAASFTLEDTVQQIAGTLFPGD
jgi:hypothetical protein